MDRSEDKVNEWQNICGDGGVLKKILKHGNGLNPKIGEKVEVHYVGTLTKTKEKFDSSRDRDTKFCFEIGGGVIKAWNEGVKTMIPGEISILRCRSDYAYGKAGSPPKIPGDTNLDFEIEYFGKQEWPETHPVPHTFLKKGGSYLTPKEEGSVKFKMTIYEDQNRSVECYSETEATIEIGNEENNNYPKVLHELLEKCAKNDILFAKLNKNDQYPLEKWNVKSKTYYLKLNIINVTNPPELWNMSKEKKKEEAFWRKEKGNNLFKIEKFEKALKNYKKGIEALNDLLKKEKKFDKINSDENEKTEKSSNKENINLYITLQSNSSMVCLKMKDNKEALVHADKGLEFDKNHLKCLTRKAQALFMMGNYERSKEIVKKCLDIDSENKYCKMIQKQCIQQIKLYKEKQKKLAKKMFS